MKKKHIIIGGILVIIIVAGASQFIFTNKSLAPQPVVSEPSLTEDSNATTSSQTTATTSADIQNKPTAFVHSIEKGDSITSWNFQGAYTNNPDLIAKAESEVERLKGLVDKGEYTNMILYVSIANQYGLLGDGKHEYEYLKYAIEEGGSTTGLPWHNLGVLMARLGATQTARIAYEKATLVQPELKQWHYAYLSFLTASMKDDVVNIEKAFASAKENIGQDADILQIYSEWKNS